LWLSFLPQKDILSIHSITNREYALSSVSPVFHGRDIMAPAAAYLSLGIDPSCLGKKCQKMKILPDTRPIRKGGKIIGRVIWIDRFGNLITNITVEQTKGNKVVRVAGEIIGPLQGTFSDVRKGYPLAYIGSGGHLEIAVREGSASEHFCKIDGDIEIEVASAE
jgi:S-adenosylmethionine hydrolase